MSARDFAYSAHRYASFAFVFAFARAHIAENVLHAGSEEAKVQEYHQILKLILRSKERYDIRPSRASWNRFFGVNISVSSLLTPSHARTHIVHTQTRIHRIRFTRVGDAKACHRVF